MESWSWMLTSERKKSALLPRPPTPHTPSLQRKINSSIWLRFPRQRSKAGAPRPGRRGASISRVSQASRAPAAPPLAPQLRRPGSYLGRRGRSRRGAGGAGKVSFLGRGEGEPGGQLGLAMSFSSAARGAQPAPGSSAGSPPAVRPAVPGASGSSASGLRKPVGTSGLFLAASSSRGLQQRPLSEPIHLRGRPPGRTASSGSSHRQPASERGTSDRRAPFTGAGEGRGRGNGP